MEWKDREIVLQAGEGGVEVRSGCELLTVLAFYHPGLLSQAEAAAAAVVADTREGCVARPTRHLPFVPCRLQPRDVILQARQRLVEDRAGGNGLEHYSKPRVTTTDASFGGDDGVNADVPQAERTVVLPRVRQLAWALAVVDTNGRDAEEGKTWPRAVARGWLMRN
eukprot:3095670-Pleurochrysis_carterae.AAC.1